MNTPSEWQEYNETTEVPPHAGIEGFILAIRKILRLPRVMNISIDSRGAISHTRYVRSSDPRKNIEIDFETIAPSAIIRNGLVVEVDIDSYQGNAAVAVAAMFARSAADFMYPVGWVISPNSHLWSWHSSSTGVVLSSTGVFGLPAFTDRFIPDETLLLACAFGPNAALIDARQAYKITMPNPLRSSCSANDLPPNDDVQVSP